MLSLEQHIGNAVKLAHQFGVAYAVVDYDHEDDRRTVVVKESSTWTPEFEAFDGRVLNVALPNGEVY